MKFTWAETEYTIEPDSSHLNIIVSRLHKWSGKGFGQDKEDHKGRQSFHPSYEAALRFVAKEGCRQFGGLTVDEVLGRLEVLGEQFEGAVATLARDKIDID